MSAFASGSPTLWLACSLYDNDEERIKHLSEAKADGEIFTKPVLLLKVHAQLKLSSIVLMLITKEILHGSSKLGGSVQYSLRVNMNPR